MKIIMKIIKRKENIIYEINVKWVKKEKNGKLYCVI